MQQGTLREDKEFDPYTTNREEYVHSDSHSLEKEIYDARYEQTKRGLYRNT
jgi:hypothetical protein